MIIKKPYAFLIKNFKIMHIILTFFLAYLAYKSMNIFSFFNSYAKNGFYSYYENINKAFLNPLLFISLVFVLLFSLIIYFVMRWKNKKRKYYLFLIIFYIIILLAIIYTSTIFSSISSIALDVKFIRSIRDIWLMLFIPQIIMIIMSIIRGLGFNIKSFNFQKDLEELEINEKDNEEIELKTGSNIYKYRRTIRKYVREFKYYIVENKKIFILIITIILLGSLSWIGIYFGNKSKLYTPTNSFYSNGLSYNINNIYITEMDYNGDAIKKGYIYVILNVNIKNNSSTRKNANLSNFIIKSGNTVYHNIPKISYFKDLGELYDNQVILSKKEGNYIIVFEINDNVDVNKVNILYSYDSFENNKSVVKYYKFTALRENLDLNRVNTSFKLNEKVDINNHIFTVESLEIKSEFTEESKVIINDKEYITTNIIKPDINSKSNYDVMRLKVITDEKVAVKELFKDYGYIEYEKNNEFLKMKMQFINSDDNYYYLYVPKGTQSTKLIFTIRNKNYIIT